MPAQVAGTAAGIEALVDEAAGFTREALNAQLAIAEATEPGARLPWNSEAVRKAKPVLERPQPGVAADSVRWREYIGYYERRLAEMEVANAAGKPGSVDPPRGWSSYQTMRDNFARGVAYQRAQVAKLTELAKQLGFSQRPPLRSSAVELRAGPGVERSARTAQPPRHGLTPAKLVFRCAGPGRARPARTSWAPHFGSLLGNILRA